MKILIFFALGLISINSYNQNIDFKDSNFKEYLINSGVDINNDYEISLNEALMTTEIKLPSVYDLPISDIYEIIYFENLEKLSCGENDLSRLDLTNNKQLKYLDISMTELDTLLIDSLKNLNYLDVTYAGIVLDSINYAKFPELRELYIWDVKAIDVSKNNKLEVLGAYYVPNIDVTANPELRILKCNFQTSLDITKNKKLESLECSGSGMDSPYVLKELDLSNNINLKELDCSQNNISFLNLSHNINLEVLECRMNPIKQLDLNKNTELNLLNCMSCELDTLDLANNPKISILVCANNKIRTLDLSNNSNLKLLSCGDNFIQSINISNCLSITDIYCENNKLLNLDFSTNINLINIQIVNNPDLENVCVWVLPFPPQGIWLNDWGCPKLKYILCIDNTNDLDYSTIPIYPNPVSNILNIDLRNASKIESVTITSSNGKVYFNQKNTALDNIIEIDTYNLPVGLYLLTIKNKEKLISKKIVKY